MKLLKTFICWFVPMAIIGVFVFFGMWACSNKIDSIRDKNAAVRAEREAAIGPLTEKESELWVEVYAAAVRRGVWYPGKVANNAIIELRKTGGEDL